MKPIAVTVGMFDGVHRGHRWLVDRMAEEARKRGLANAVVTFDRHPLETIAPDRAPALLTTLDDRCEQLRLAGADDVIVLKFDQRLRRLTAREFMEMLRDRYGVVFMVMGYDHRFGSDRLSHISDYQAISRELGMQVINVEEWQHDAAAKVSSSEVRRAIADGDVARARSLLGRNYRLRGTVVSGHKIGRTLGFPTANIEPVDSRQLVPAPGVYVVDVILADGHHRGMVNIGTRPTVDHSSHPATTIEVHIIDWDGDIYNQEIALDFVSRLRDEQKFESVDELRRQLIADMEAARAVKSL